MSQAIRVTIPLTRDTAMTAFSWSSLGLVSIGVGIMHGVGAGLITLGAALLVLSVAIYRGRDDE